MKEAKSERQSPGRQAGGALAQTTACGLSTCICQPQADVGRHASSSGTATAAPGKGFPRRSRLLKHPLFEQVYKRGQRHFSANMTVFYLERTGPGGADKGPPPGSAVPCAGARVGFTVGRALGGAVERNRIKRRMRAAVRESLGVLPGTVDVVINPKKKTLGAEFARLVEEVSSAFRVVRARTANRVG